MTDTPTPAEHGPEAIAALLTKDEVRCVLTIDDPDIAKRAPIPDSMWHGGTRFLRRTWGQSDESNLSPTGQAVRAAIARAHGAA